MGRLIAEVEGDGIGGTSAAVALARKGWDVRVLGGQPRGGHPIALNNAGRYLIKEIWGSLLLERLHFHTLTRRVIAWHASSPEVIRDTAVVVDSALLTQEMSRISEAEGVATCMDRSSRAADWTIVAKGGCPEQSSTLRGGTRVAVAIPVVLRPTADFQALHIEETELGWLALLPTSRACAVVFAVLPKAAAERSIDFDELLPRSCAIRRSVAEVAGSASRFESAPILRRPPFMDAPGVFAGKAAIALDPMSGDGAAAALRTAHLAVSLAEAFTAGGSLPALRRFYECRLARAMHSHLNGLLALYRHSSFVSTWNDEIAAMTRMSESIRDDAEDPSGRAFRVSQTGMKVVD